MRDRFTSVFIVNDSLLTTYEIYVFTNVRVHHHNCVRDDHIYFVVSDLILYEEEMINYEYIICEFNYNIENAIKGN